jgi:hypothetical protein
MLLAPTSTRTGPVPPTAACTTIDDVIAGLDALIARAVEEGDRIGYFACLYRHVTIEVQRAIERGEFEDDDRMCRFDAAFGNRYFGAVRRWHDDADRPADAWREAFRLHDDDGSVIVQHLLLGLNAHINLDLAVAAAEVAPGPAVVELERDFFLINDILVHVLDLVQESLNQVSPLMRLLDDVGGRTDEQILEFSIRRARREAWRNARILAEHPVEGWRPLVALLDDRATALARIVARPRWFLRPALDVVRRAERHEVGVVVERLAGALDPAPA